MQPTAPLKYPQIWQVYLKFPEVIQRLTDWLSSWTMWQGIYLDTRTPPCWYEFTRPALYIGVCIIGWGLTSLLTGVCDFKTPFLCTNYDLSQITKDFSGILACRVFIGIPETAFYPGAMYLLSRWYTKKVSFLSSETWILYSGLLFSNAFGAVSRHREKCCMMLKITVVDCCWNPLRYGRCNGNQSLEVASDPI